LSRQTDREAKRREEGVTLLVSTVHDSSCIIGLLYWAWFFFGLKKSLMSTQSWKTILADPVSIWNELLFRWLYSL